MDAEHHQAHKDDEGQWEQVPAPRRRSEKRRLNSIVSVRFRPSEADELRRRAARMGMSMSGYLRWKALSDTYYMTNLPSAVTTTVAGPVLIHYPDVS